VAIEVGDVNGVYGSMNDLSAGDQAYQADRRDTASTSALQNVIAGIYTPDSLQDKNEFRGLLLFSKPSKFPIRTSKDAYFEALAVEEANSPYQALGTSHYYYYYVLIPELEPRKIDFNDKESIPKRLATFDLVYMSPELVQAGQNRRITPGTQVTVRFGNMERLQDPVITNIGPLLFNFDITGLVPSDKFPFGRAPTLSGMVGHDGDHLDPKGNSNATYAVHAHLAEPKHTPADIKACSDKYDADPSYGGKHRSRNDKRIALLNPEAQPYCKCFIVRCKEIKIDIMMNSTTRTVKWQRDHRRWYVEGTACPTCQTIICGKAYGIKGDPVNPALSTTKIVRGTSGVISWKFGAGWHTVGFAWDFNPTITMPDGKRVRLTNSSASNLWDTCGIGEICQGLGVYWGGGGPTGRDINDQIHVGGGPLVKRLSGGKLNKGYKVFAAEKEQGASQGGLDFDKWKAANPSETPS